jgi:uncharacterized protein
LFFALGSAAGPDGADAEFGRSPHDDTTRPTGRRGVALEESMNAPSVQVVDNAAEGRYEVLVGDRVVGFSEYRLDDDRIVFLHTETDAEVKGQGFGSRLAAGALADARGRGLKIVAECPFIAAYLRRHPQR